MPKALGRPALEFCRQFRATPHTCLSRIYTSHDLSPGSVSFLPYGAHIFNLLVEFSRKQARNFGFHEVITPLFFKKQLWQTSGHWTHYHDDMFQVCKPSNGTQSAGYQLKPMNCPGHCLLYQQAPRAANELPLRFTEYSPLHRNESSGALVGLTRTRKFHQDDGHVFCRPDQIQEEVEACLELIRLSYHVFDLRTYRLALSTRPTNEFIGELCTWDRAETDLRMALDKSGVAWSINAGEGAFYGPKIDILVKDRAGKEHQTATIQLDFQLPANFGLEYINPDNSHGRPVIIHRAVFGSVERFMGILTSHYDGKWPLWLNPNQVAVLPVAERHEEYARSVQTALTGQQCPKSCVSLSQRRFNVDIHASGETIGSRVRKCISLGYSYIVILGDKELEAQNVAFRTVSDRTAITLTVEKFKDLLQSQEDNFK